MSEEICMDYLENNINQWVSIGEVAQSKALDHMSAQKGLYKLFKNSQRWKLENIQRRKVSIEKIKKGQYGNVLSSVKIAEYKLKR